VGVRNLASDLLPPPDPPGGAAESTDGAHHHHDIFVECGWCFYYPDSRKFSAATQPLVRVWAPQAAGGPRVFFDPLIIFLPPSILF
jgi:hypothetical protein